MIENIKAMKGKALVGLKGALAALDSIAAYLDGAGDYPDDECVSSLVAHAITIEEAFVGDWSHWYSDETHQYPILCPTLRFLSHTFSLLESEDNFLYLAVLTAAREEVTGIIRYYEVFLQTS